MVRSRRKKRSIYSSYAWQTYSPIIRVFFSPARHTMTVHLESKAVLRMLGIKSGFRRRPKHFPVVDEHVFSSTKMAFINGCGRCCCLECTKMAGITIHHGPKRRITAIIDVFNGRGDESSSSRLKSVLLIIQRDDGRRRQSIICR